MGKLNYTIVDHDGESSTVGMNSVDLTAGNFAAEVAELDAVTDAIDAVILGTPRNKVIQAITEEIAGVLPANPFAQREIKWLVSGNDANGQPHTMEIPTADLQHLSANTGTMDLTAGVGLALKTALDTAWKTRTGVAITVNSVTHVGRNI